MAKPSGDSENLRRVDPEGFGGGESVQPTSPNSGLPMKRKAITAAELYVLMDREFRRIQPSGCDSCFVQLPYRVDRRDEAAPNWEMLVPAACPEHCAVVLHELVTRYSAEYDLAPEAET